MVTTLKINTPNRAQILDESVCILPSDNTLQKDIESSFLLPAKGKIEWNIGSLNLSLATGQGEGKLLIQIC